MPHVSLLPFEPQVAHQSECREERSTADGAIISLSTYMTDKHTRVADYNGRKLVSIVGREKFGGERVIRLPSRVIEFASRQPVTSALLPCRIGYSPKARGQKVFRPNGDWSYTLLLCLDGEGRLELSNSRERITPGKVVLLRPFEFHAYEADADNPWSLYWVHFNGRMAREYHDLLTAGGKRPCTTIKPDVRLTQSFEHIRGLYLDGNAYPLLVQASAIMHQLLGDIHDKIRTRQRGETPEDVQTKIQRTIEIMRENPRSNMTIHEFAAATHLSQMYFAAKFRQYTGESPRSYFTRIKMKRACQLLVETRLKVEIVAELVGYEDAFYFSRAFKRVIGDTPSGYRVRQTCDHPDEPLLRMAP